MSYREEEQFARFLAQIGHEIRTPLNAIKGFGDLLVEEQVGELNSVQKKYLQKMTDSAEKLLLVVNQILDWAKLESNQIALELQPVELQRIAQEVGGLLELPLRQKQLVYQVQQDCDTTILGDWGRLREVLVNLVGNSIKFSQPGGQINVCFARTAEDLICAVADNGCGMAPEQQKTMFEPFARGENRPGEEKNTGLGLWICRSVVELHGGQIWAESRQGQGTTVSFRIPVVTA